MSTKQLNCTQKNPGTEALLVVYLLMVQLQMALQVSTLVLRNYTPAVFNLAPRFDRDAVTDNNSSHAIRFRAPHWGEVCNC